MAKISVIVPIYNVEPYLHRCVDSIIAQTYQDFEIILIDDGSPDGCPQICDEYAAQDKRIHVIHQQNGGLSAARNSGIDWAFDNSDSEWITFIDSDDWVYPQYLEYLYRAASENNAEISACDTFFAKDEQIEKTVSDYAIDIMKPEDYWVKFGGYCSVAWEKLYKKGLFADVRFPVGKIHEDEFTTYKAVFKANRIAVLPNRLYIYYYGNSSIMRSAWSPKRIVSIEAFLNQTIFFREYGYSHAERISKNNFKKAVLSNRDNINQNRKEFACYKSQISDYIKNYLKISIGKGVIIIPYIDELWICCVYLTKRYESYKSVVRTKVKEIIKKG